MNNEQSLSPAQKKITEILENAGWRLSQTTKMEGYVEVTYAWESTRFWIGPNGQCRSGISEEYSLLRSTSPEGAMAIATTAANWARQDTYKRMRSRNILMGGIV